MEAVALLEVDCFLFLWVFFACFLVVWVAAGALSLLGAGVACGAAKPIVAAANAIISKLFVMVFLLGGFLSPAYNLMLRQNARRNDSLERLAARPNSGLLALTFFSLSVYRV